MPFHFKKAEPPGRAVRRVIREHTGEALKCLGKSRHPAAIHGVRKEIKKLRAIYRLVRGEIGRAAYRKATKALRRATDRLAASRDARVTLQALEHLAGGGAARRFPKIQKALEENCRLETCRFRDDDSVAVAKQILRKINRRVSSLKIKADGWAALEPGLRQSYRRGRQAAELARQQPSPENFHEWRKQVKNFWYQLRLLCPEWRAAARDSENELEQLGELLGADHDLVLVKQFVAEHRARHVAEAKALNQLIESRQNELRAAACKLGLRLYAETPAAVCARLGRHWNAWHGEAVRH
jgi:CHAD domain-containing protein